LFSISDSLTIDVGSPLDEREINHVGKVENPALALEQELYVEGSTVVWSRAGYILKTFDYSSEEQLIRQVLFAWFPINSISDPTAIPAIDTGLTNLDIDYAAEGYLDKKGGFINFNSSVANNENKIDQIQRRTLCIVFQDCIKVHTEDGLNVTIHIPFEIGDVVPLDVGILVSKYYTPEVNKSKKVKSKNVSNLVSMATSSTNTTTTTASTTRPKNELESSVFVTITRPLRGACPVNSKDSPVHSRISVIPEPLTNPQKLLFATTKSSETGRLPVIVTLNIKENKHCIWTYDRRKEKSIPVPPLPTAKRKHSIMSLSSKKKLGKQPSRKRQKLDAIDSPHAQFHEDYISDDDIFYETENDRDIYHELLDPSEISLRLLWKESHGVK
jgi:hypothetical protein